MIYRVELTARASRNLRRIYQYINAKNSKQARDWFNGLEIIILSLENHPTRGAVISEDNCYRHLLYGKKPHIYRIIYAIDERHHAVNVLHIRHSARDTFMRMSAK